MSKTPLEVLWLAGEGPSGPVYTGSVPESDQAFDALTALGVLTILSVDGAAPDLDRAAARGIHYVHLPLGYDDINEHERLTLAAVVRDFPGPIYIHCHHGKHRGPAAAAIALRSLDLISTPQALAVLEQAGTSKSYPGLWRSVENSTRASGQALDAIEARRLPSHASVSSFVEAMVEIDRTFDRLGAIARAGWTTPTDHPDLVPAAEAGRLADLFRLLIEHDANRGSPARLGSPTGLSVGLRSSAGHAASLEEAIVTNHQHAARVSFAQLKQDCRSCHEAYRR